MSRGEQAGPLDLSTPSGRMVARQLGAVARFESEHKAERVRAARLQAAQAAKPQGGPRPFGYEPDGVTVRDVEAAAVRSAVEAVLAGASLRSVAREFNEAGLITSLKGRPWDHHSVSAVLLRPRNAGLRTATVTVLPVNRPGPWFDPATIRIEPKNQQA